MNAKIICMASAKGGTGKTVIAASLAQFLAKIGNKVLLIDMDLSTNGLTLIYLKELIQYKEKQQKERSENIYGIFETKGHLIPTSFKLYKNLDLIPSMYTLKKTPPLEIIIIENLPKIIQDLRSKYDYIILDAQAGTDGLFTMEIADEIVIVTEYDPISAEGVDRLRSLFPKILTYEKTWILINKVLPDFHKSLGDFLQVFRILSPIPWDIEVVKAYTKRRIALDMERGNDYTIAIMETALSLFGFDIEEQINNWKEKIEKTLRTPSINQLNEIKQNMLKLERKKIETEFELRDNKLKFYITIATFFSVAIIYPFAFYFGTENSPLPSVERIFMIVIIPIIFIGAIIIFRARLFKLIRNREQILKLELSKIDSEMDDLKERLKKYLVIAESDLENLVKESDRIANQIRKSRF